MRNQEETPEEQRADKLGETNQIESNDAEMKEDEIRAIEPMEEAQSSALKEVTKHITPNTTTPSDSPILTKSPTTPTQTTGKTQHNTGNWDITDSDLEFTQDPLEHTKINLPNDSHDDDTEMVERKEIQGKKRSLAHLTSIKEKAKRKNEKQKSNDAE